VDLTEKQMELLFEAWTISRADPPMGMVLKPHAFPDAHELAEQGWLRRAFVGDDLAWFWTDGAETAFDYSNLLTSADGRQN
jgi:hypothetical protein